MYSVASRSVFPVKAQQDPQLPWDTTGNVAHDQSMFPAMTVPPELAELSASAELPASAELSSSSDDSSSSLFLFHLYEIWASSSPSKSSSSSSVYDPSSSGAARSPSLLLSSSRDLSEFPLWSSITLFTSPDSIDYLLNSLIVKLF